MAVLMEGKLRNCLILTTFKFCITAKSSTPFDIEEEHIKELTLSAIQNVVKHHGPNPQPTPPNCPKPQRPLTVQNRSKIDQKYNKIL